MVLSRLPLEETTRELVAVATGKNPADQVILGGRVVSVFTGEILNWDIAITGKRIATVGDVSHTIGPNTGLCCPAAPPQFLWTPMKSPTYWECTA